MELRIESATAYAYDASPRRSTQYLRMTPQSGPGQTVTDWLISAPGRLSPWTDMFGNRCHTLTLENPSPDMHLTISGAVTTRETSGILPASATDSLPRGVYLRETDYARLDHALRDYAEAHRAGCEADPLEGLHTLMTDIHRDVAYDEEATTVLTTAQEAFDHGRGVCQDHAHILIATARHLGVPTRYVSGYLWTGSHGQTHSASHAWAECWVEKLGWISFDPANGVSASDAYVRVAVGFDYATASPVRGVRVGGGGERLTVEVRLFRDDPGAVAQVQQQHQS